MLTFLAVIELRACYRERRNGIARCRSVATKVSFAMVAVLSTGLFCGLPSWERKSNVENIVWERQIAKNPPAPNDNDKTLGWLTNQLFFVVTSIQQNEQCDEPHSLLVKPAQYLRFVLEVWLDVEQFANPSTAHALALPHWSIQDGNANSTGSLYMHAKCGRGLEAISEPIVPGAHTITDVVVSAPWDATSLKLEVPIITECGTGLSPGKGKQSQLAQRLLQIGDQVSDVLDADRQPHQVVGNLQLRTDRRRMGHRARVSSISRLRPHLATRRG